MQYSSEPIGFANLGPSNKTTLTYPGAGDSQADNPGRSVTRGIDAIVGDFRPPQAYRNCVLPPNVTARVAVEQASLGWERSVGTSGQVVGMNTFRASAPLKELQRKFGFEPEHVVGLPNSSWGRK